MIEWIMIMKLTMSLMITICIVTAMRTISHLLVIPQRDSSSRVLMPARIINMLFRFRATVENLSRFQP